MRNLLLNAKLIITGDFFAFFLLMLLAIIALYNDVKYFKVPNKLNLVFIIIGLIINLLAGNIKQSLLGIVFPLVLIFLFALRMIGAGDIKLFCAMGSIIGLEEIIKIIIFSILLNGIIACFLILIRKNAKKSFEKLFIYLKLCVYSKKLYKYNSDFKEKENNKSYFRYVYGIFLAVLCRIIAFYFI